MRFSTLLATLPFTAAYVPHSPFPAPVAGFNATHLLFSIDTSALSASDSLAAATVQGVFSQQRGPLMYRVPGATSDYALWLSETARLFNVTVNASWGSDFWGLLASLSSPSPIKGYVLTDLTDGSVNAALALCTVLGGVAVTAENEARARQSSLPLLADARGHGLDWVLANVVPGGNFSARVTMIQAPSKTGMSDVAIAMRALPWFPATNASEPLAQRVWGALAPPFFALGWGPDEKTTVTEASRHGGAVIASDWASNLDVLASFDLPAFSPPPPPPLRAPRAPPGAVHTAAFLMSDGDNAQFVLGGFATSGSFWGSPDRGRVPMGWTMPGALADLAPAALRYFYATASGSDSFVAGVSGAAYFYPDAAAAAGQLAPLAELTREYAAKAGLRVANVMTAADGVLPAAIAEAYLSGGEFDALVHYPYSDYAGDHGAISFVGGKPVIGGRFSLWGDGTQGADFKNVEQAALALALAKRDPTTQDGYSLCGAPPPPPPSLAPPLSPLLAPAV
jgi:hypothetical protein